MNQLSQDKKISILKCLTEGNSLRATSRIVGVARNTVTELMVSVGESCERYLDGAMINLKCSVLQIDEIWNFIGCKDKAVKKGKVGLGSIWTWVAIDPKTKLVPSWYTGARTTESTRIFFKDLAKRLTKRIQLTTDGYQPYEDVIEDIFHGNIDYAMIVKKYEKNVYAGCDKFIISGEPNDKRISTSLIERQNLTMRMCMRRFTRKTNAFSKKLENHKAAIALHFLHYNFIRPHQTLKTTPAHAAGLAPGKWRIEFLLEL